MYQQTTIIGNVGSEPQMRYLPDGTAVTNFSVAANKNWKDSNGVDHQVTTWFRVSTWGKQAEVMNQHLQSGALIMVTGELQPDTATGGPRTYVRKDGTVAASYELRANQVKFLSSKPLNGNATAEGESDDVPY